MIFLFILFIVSIALIVISAHIFYRYHLKGAFLLAPSVVLFFIDVNLAVDMINIMNPVFIGAIAGIVISRGKSFQFYLIGASLLSGAIIAFTFYFYLYVLDVDILELSKASFIEGLDGMGAPSDIEEIVRSDIDGWVDTVVRIVPFLSFMFALFSASLGWVFIKLFFENMKTGLKLEGLEKFRMHEYFIIVLIAGLALFLLVDGSINYALHSIGLNMMLASLLVYVVQGLGVIKYFLLSKGVPGQVLPLGIGVIFIIGAGALLFSYIIVGGLGALDLWADFRKMDKNNLTDRGEK